MSGCVFECAAAYVIECHAALLDPEDEGSTAVNKVPEDLVLRNTSMKTSYLDGRQHRNAADKRAVSGTEVRHQNPKQYETVVCHYTVTVFCGCGGH